MTDNVWRGGESFHAGLGLGRQPVAVLLEAVGGKLLGSQKVEIGGITLEEDDYGWGGHSESHRTGRGHQCYAKNGSTAGRLSSIMAKDRQTGRRS